MDFSNAFISATLFTQIHTYVLTMVQDFGYAGMGRMLQVTMAIGSVCLSLWFIWQGWCIATGQTRDTFLVFGGRAITAIVAVATAQGFALTGVHWVQFVSDMQNTLALAITGDQHPSPTHMLGQVLSYMLALQSVLQIYQSGTDNPQLLGFITGAGQAFPAFLAGGLGLLNEVALHLCLVFAPIFILCYLSLKTRFLFANWLKFTITTLVSMVVLTVVTVIALKAIITMSVTLLALTSNGLIPNSPFSSLFASTPAPALNDIATVTGGVGLLLSTLILGVPPLVVNFFSGGLSAISNGYNAFGQQALGARASPSTNPYIQSIGTGVQSQM